MTTETIPDQQLPVRVITPHEGSEAFTYAITSIIRDFSQSRALAWRIFVRDTKAQYRQSLLGYVWLILPPLATVFVWVFLNNQKLVNIDSGDVPYPVFVLTGTVLWAAFNGSIMAMLGVLGGARGSLSKINFPHEALIMTAFLKALLNSVIPAVLLIPALFIYGINFENSMLLFPIGFITLMLLGSALGLLFVPIGALFTDINAGLQLALRFGFFVTPVIYALPETGITRTLLLWNPVTAPLVTSRAWLVGGESPVVPEMIIVAMLSFIVLCISVVAFKVAMPHLIERIGS